MSRAQNLLKIMTLAAAVALSSGPAQALDQDLDLRQYGVDTWTSLDGLPQITIQSLLQSREGYMWIGTQDGLVRFDGVRFEHYNTTTTPVILHDDIQSLAQTGDGSVWAATYGGGLIRFHDNECTRMETDLGLDGQSNVLSLHVGRSGRLYVGTLEDGLYSWADGRIRREPLPPRIVSAGIHAVVEDPLGTVWIGTNHGLARGDADGWTLVPLPGTQPYPALYALYSDNDGTIWCGTPQGLLALKNGTFTSHRSRSGDTWDYVRVIMRDSQDVMWVGTYGVGLQRMHEGWLESEIPDDLLGDDSVHSLCEDSDGGLWVGTVRNGVSRLRDTPFASLNRRTGLPADHVTVLHPTADGGLWIGADSGGLIHYKDGKVRSLSMADGLPSTTVGALCVARDGSVWVGTERGVSHYKDGKFVTYGTVDGLAHENIRALYEDSRGRIWIGTRGGGVTLIEDGKLTNYDVNDGLPVNIVRWITEDRRGQLWVATESGVAIWRDGHFETVGADLGMVPQYTMHLHEDADGVMWIATYGGGLIRYKDGRADFLRVDDGLYEDTLYSVSEDAMGRLWLPCNRGIFGIRKSDIDAYLAGSIPKIPSLVFGPQNGFPGTECNGGSQPSTWTLPDGRIWFATNGGAALFDPSEVTPDLVPPTVVIEKVTVDHNRLQDKNLDHVEPGRRDLEITYTGLSFRDPHAIRFRYMLEGFDTQWNNAEQRRTAYYTNLPPGRYTFRVSASNANGVWNEEGRAVSFTLLPYFRETALFRALCVLAGVSLVLALWLWRYRQMQARQEELEVMVREKTRELAAAKEAADMANDAKSAFLANMSHEIRTPMNAIVSLTDLVRETPLAPDQKESLDLVSMSAQGLLELINDILDFSKIEAEKLELESHSFELRSVVDDTIRTMALRAEQRGLDLSGRVAPGVPPVLIGDSHRLKQILLNLIGNAIKFTEEGEVAVDVSLAATRQDGVLLRLEITDTGRGISPEAQRHIFEPFTQADASVTRRHGGTGLGLTICTRLVECFGGEIGVYNNEAGGATFHFTVQLGVDRDAVSENDPQPGNPLGDLKVLVVDTGRRHRDRLAEILSGWGLHPLVTADSAEARDMLRAAAGEGEAFDLMVFEHAPPACDAADLQTMLETEPGLVPSTIIAATLGSLGQARRFNGPAVMGHLVKPIKQQELLRTLGTLSPHRRSRRSGEAPRQATDGRDIIVGGLRILVAEDNPVNQVVARRLLERHGAEVLLAGNGVEALHTLETQHVDLVLMDVQMPEMDGLEATRTLRQREAATGGRHVPVISLTAHALLGDRERCIEAGADDYVSKPIDAAVLFEVIARQMEAREQPQC